MIRAYDEMYLRGAMRNLGEMMNYAVCDCHADPDGCFQMFAVSGDAEEFGRGNPRYIAGMSGAELAADIFCKCGCPEMASVSPGFYPDRSPEYWCGWILAYYQWYTGRSFERIRENLTCSEIISLYNPLHEGSEERAVRAFENRIAEREQNMTQLKRLRKYAHLTQAQLAAKAGVSLRSIQMYEERQKDINKAQVMTILSIARVLGCRPENLVET